MRRHHARVAAAWALVALVGCSQDREHDGSPLDARPAVSRLDGALPDTEGLSTDTRLLADARRPTADAAHPTADEGPPADAVRPTVDSSLPTADAAQAIADIAPSTADVSLPAADAEVLPDADVVPPEISVGYVRIEAGMFTMGSPAGPEPPAEPGRNDDETQHQVTLTHSFLMKETEVTQWEWEDLMGDRPSGFPDCGPTCPVETVTWFEAVAYCNVLSIAEGLARCYADAGGEDYDRMDAIDELIPVWRDGLDCTGYRLPTEQEWEYAARAGSTEASYAGPVADVDCELEPNLDGIAWYCGNSNDMTHPVAGRGANAWGLYDMLGNVWEWNWDWYGDYPDGPGQDYLGALGGGLRVERGGSFESVTSLVRSANRNGAGPHYLEITVGFRPARSL